MTNHHATQSSISVIESLRPVRLSKYLYACRNDPRQALRLYEANNRVSTALFADLHYLEVVLRNKMDRLLAIRYGECWPYSQNFLDQLDSQCNKLLSKAKHATEKHSSGKPAPTDRVVAELTFGFWHMLTNARYEHTLWTPCLHKVFYPNKPMGRGEFNKRLDDMRSLRNRIAHHEPIFHWPLHQRYKILVGLLAKFDPITTRWMLKHSDSKRQIMRLGKTDR